MKYKAFISYRHLEPDRTAAVAVHRMLEKYVVPTRLRQNGARHFGRIFRDEDELPLSASLSDSIQYALEESEFLIVICTPQFQESLWCMKEVETFLRLRDRDHVLAVLVTGRPEESFPPQLLEDEQGNPCEPLAANLSSDDPGVIRKRLRQEHLRLAAAMIGCDYDDLVRRARRRRVRLVASAALVTLTAAIAFISVLLVKNAQVSRALRQAQRNESEAVSFVAVDLLSKGDRSAAAEKAVSALPRPEEPDRPYVAGCEEVLADALYVYHDSRFFLQRALVDTFEVIQSVAVARDGSAAFAGYKEGVVRAISPEGKILWTIMIPGWEKSDAVQLRTLAEGRLLASSSKGVCFLDPESGTVIRQETKTLLAGQDRFLLMQSGDHYFLTNQEGSTIREFMPDPGPEYTFGHWSLSAEGRVAFLADTVGKDDSVFLKIVDEFSGQIGRTVPLEVSSDSSHNYSLFLTDELALVYGWTIDLYALMASDDDCPHTELTAYRLADGTEAWHWETDNLSYELSFLHDPENHRVFVMSPFSSLVVALSEEDGRVLSEIKLPSDVKTLVPYISNAGLYCLRAFLENGSVININPETGFSMAFGGASTGISSVTDANPLDGRISAAGAALDAPQAMVLISRTEIPGDRVLLGNILNTAIAVGPDGKILTAKKIEDKEETELSCFDPASPENSFSVTVPIDCAYKFMGITEEGNLAVFAGMETDITEIAFVSLDDGSVIIPDNSVFWEALCSRPGKEVWSVHFDFDRTKMEIRRNGAVTGSTTLPETWTHGTEAIGAGWLAVAVSDEDGTSSLHICDLVSGAWNQVPDAHTWNNPLLACGVEQKQLAVVDNDGIFILDESLHIIRSFSLPVDRFSVTGITFSLDDRLICLSITGDRVCLFRISDSATSGIVSCSTVNTCPWVERTASGDYTVAFGRYSYYPGLVLSGEDLSVRARVPGMIGILPETDTMLRAGEMQSNPRLILSPVYSLEELLEMSENSLP